MKQTVEYRVCDHCGNRDGVMYKIVINDNKGWLASFDCCTFDCLNKVAAAMVARPPVRSESRTAYLNVVKKQGVK